MSRFAYILVIALAASSLPAQVVTVSPSTQTSGMVGIISGQTAQLNVVNVATPLVTPVASNIIVNCIATLAFFDSNGNSLESETASISPGKAVSLPLPYSSPRATAVGRLEIRGAVTTVPLLTPAGGTPVASTPCTLVLTLEVIDNISQQTLLVL